MNETATKTTELDTASIRTHTIITYALLTLGCFTGGLLSIAGVIWAYVKRGEAKGTIFESHMSNAIKTFWVGVVLAIVGFLTAMFVVGYLILLAAVIYTLYKYVKGLIKVLDNKAYN